MTPEQKTRLIDAIDLLAEAQHINEAAHMATSALDKRARNAMAQVIATVENRLADVERILSELLPEEGK